MHFGLLKPQTLRVGWQVILSEVDGIIQAMWRIVRTTFMLVVVQHLKLSILCMGCWGAAVGAPLARILFAKADVWLIS